MLFHSVRSVSLIVFLAFSSLADAAVKEIPQVPASSLDSAIPASGAPASQPSVIWLDDQLVTLYARPDDRVVLRRGQQILTLDDEAPTKGGGYFRLYYDGRILYALWWKKGPRGQKRLHLRASKDKGKSFGPLHVLNSGGGVLPQFDIADDRSGSIAVAFMDERDIGYQIYVNRSNDGGDSWLTQDVRIDDTALTDKKEQQPAQAALPEKPVPAFAVEPRLVYSGQRLTAVWQQQDRLEGGAVLRWLARTSDDGGKTWQATEEIYRETNKSPFEMITFVHQDRIYVFGFVAERGLMAFRSEKNGNGWQALGAVPGTAGDKKLAISWLRAAASADNILVSYTTQKQGQKSRAYVAALSVSSGTWQKQPWRLDRKDHELTKAGIVESASLPDGTAIVVWVDYRNLLPAVYLDYSSDGGSTWAKAPLALTEPGLYQADSPRLIQADDRILVVYDRTDREDGQALRRIFYQTLPYDKATGLKVPVATNPYDKLSLQEKNDRIKKRMTEFWALRNQGKFEQTWEYYNTMYRSSFPNKYSWLAKQAKISYSDFTITGDPTFNGPLGEVPYTVSASMPQQILGEMIAEVPPPKTVQDKMRWGWFYDDWYFIPETIFKKHLQY